VLRDLSQFKDLPIIALTAHARDEDKQTCLRLGMNDHVAKPVKPDTLYAAIARQLEHRQSITRH
jgi:CheY-like chemotaxis protein